MGKFLLIGKRTIEKESKKRERLIVQLFDDKNKTILRAVGDTREDLRRNMSYKFEEIQLTEKPRILNGFRLSESSGDYISCEGVSKETKEMIELIIS